MSDNQNIANGTSVKFKAGRATSFSTGTVRDRETKDGRVVFYIVKRSGDDGTAKVRPGSIKL